MAGLGTVVLLAALLAELGTIWACPTGCSLLAPLHCYCERQNFADVPAGEASLQTLDLGWNNITVLTSRIFQSRGYENLTTLNLPANKIATISSDAFRGLSKLTMLNLLQNNLFSIAKDVFSHLPSLETLILEGNPLTAITGTSKVAPRLKVLDISSCHISHLENVFRPNSREDASWLNTLDLVYARNNNISCITNEMVDMINRTTLFVLIGNPLRPNCVSPRFADLKPETGVELAWA